MVTGKSRRRIWALTLGIVGAAGFASAALPEKTERGAPPPAAPQFTSSQIIVRFRSVEAMGLESDRSRPMADLAGPSSLRALHSGNRLTSLERITPQSAPTYSAKILERAAQGGLAKAAGIRKALDRTAILSFDSPDSLDRVVRQYQADPNVEWAEVNGNYSILLTPNDPAFGSLWGMTKIAAPAAWDVTQGQGVVVAVSDTGIDYLHPDLAANMWTNPGEIPANGIDDDANGFVDDVHGYDCVGVGDGDPKDDHYHGTHVAGTVGAVGNNGLGVIGVAPAAKLMAVKGLNAVGTGNFTDLAETIRYAADNGADVINMSWGGPTSSALIEDALQYAHALGVVLVAAAGNSNKDASGAYPAAYPQVITVSAFDVLDNKAGFSNYGNKIDVAAPGVNIHSTKPGNTYGPLDGTSMAAPHVSGLAALLAAQEGNRTNEQIRTILRSFADDVGAPGFDIHAGHGRINANRAVRQIAPTPPTVTITHPGPGAVLTGPVTMTGTAADDDGVQRVEIWSGTFKVGTADGTSSWSYVLNPALIDNGPVTLTAYAFDSNGTPGSASLQVIVDVPGAAGYQAAWGTAGCAFSGGLCDSRSLFLGRDSLASGPEPHQPNTLSASACADGPSGAYKVDESIERVSIASLDGGPLKAGKPAQVVVRAWVYSSTQDALDLYSSKQVGAPDWKHLGTLKAGGTGLQVMSATYTLPTGALQAVRANFRFLGSPSPCSNGPYDDRDDLVFAVESGPDTVPPTVSLISPSQGAIVGPSTTFSATASDENGVQRVEFFLDGTLLGLDESSPYGGTWSLGTASGAHVVSAQAVDLSGNRSVPSTRNVVIDPTPPSIAVLAPAPGSIVKGTVTIHGTAWDNLAVTQVHLFLDGVRLQPVVGTGTWSHLWNADTVSPGSHTITAIAFDQAGQNSSSYVQVNVQDPGTAKYDPSLKVPRCDNPSEPCDTGRLVLGRGLMIGGIELNQPNTLAGSPCPDGNGGTFHVDESLDRVRILPVGGGPLRAWGQTTIEATVWDFGNDYLDLYAAKSATAPVWTLIGTTPAPGKRGIQVLKATHTLTGGPLQAIRARFRYGGSPAVCGTGSFTDHDDVAFAVLTEPPAPTDVSLVNPLAGSLRLVWVSTGPEITNHYVDLSTSPAFDHFVPGYKDHKVASPAWRSLALEGLQPETTYFARLRAENPAGSSPYSATAAGATTPRPDLEAVSVKIVPDLLRKGQSAELQWTWRNVGRGPASGSQFSIVPSAPSGFGLSGGMRDLAPGETRSDGNASQRATQAGVFTLTYKVTSLWEVDTANNVASTTFRVDGASPTVTVTSPAAGSTVSGPVTVAADAGDDLGVAHVAFLLDGVLVSSVSSAPYQWTWDTSLSADGAHVLGARATDLVGNVTETQVSVSVLEPNRAQTAYRSPPPATMYTNQRRTLTVQMKNTGTAVWTRAGGYALMAQNPPLSAAWSVPKVDLGTTESIVPGGSKYFYIYSVAPSTPGTYPLAYRMAKSSTGFGAWAYDESVQVLMDVSPPSVPGGVTFYGPSVNQIRLKWNGSSDNAGVREYRVDVARDAGFADFVAGWQDRSVGTARSATVTGLSAGATYHARVRAVDVNHLASGSSLPATGTTLATPDVTAPEVAIVTPGANQLVSGQVLVEASATDAGSGVYYVYFYVDGVAKAVDTSAPYQYWWNTAGLVGGKVLTARAYDYAGRSALSAPVNVFVDGGPSPAAALVRGMLDQTSEGKLAGGGVSVSFLEPDAALERPGLPDGLAPPEPVVSAYGIGGLDGGLKARLEGSQKSRRLVLASDPVLIETGQAVGMTLAHRGSRLTGLGLYQWGGHGWAKVEEARVGSSEASLVVEDPGLYAVFGEGTVEPERVEVTVYPNPVRGGRARVRAVVGAADSVRVSVMDLRGRVVRESEMKALLGVSSTGEAAYEEDLDFGDLSSGVYLCTVEWAKSGQTGRQTQKIMVLK